MSRSGRRLQPSKQQAPSARCHDLEDVQGHGGTKNALLVSAGSTALPQCSTEGMTPCAGTTTTTRREQSDA